MPYRDPGGHSRWRRLAPRDGIDRAFLSLAAFGLLLSLLVWAGLDGGELGLAAAAFIVGPLLVLHGSTPFFFFLGAAFYLTRGGRTIGHTRWGVWIGFALTAPLWFLVGQPLAVRGLGDATWLLVLWNLLALGVMSGAVWKELHHGEGSSRRVSS